MNYDTNNKKQTIMAWVFLMLTFAFFFGFALLAEAEGLTIEYATDKQWCNTPYGRYNVLQRADYSMIERGIESLNDKYDKYSTHVLLCFDSHLPEKYVIENHHTGDGIVRLIVNHEVEKLFLNSLKRDLISIKDHTAPTNHNNQIFLPVFNH